MLAFNRSEFHVLVQLSKFKNKDICYLIIFTFSLSDRRKGCQIEKIFGEKEVHRLFELSIDQSVWINIHFVFALKTDGHTGVRSRISDLIRYTTKGFI